MSTRIFVEEVVAILVKRFYEAIRLGVKRSFKFISMSPSRGRRYIGTESIASLGLGNYLFSMSSIALANASPIRAIVFPQPR